MAETKPTRHTVQTTHHIFFSDSSAMTAIPDASVHLVVTSPPYPMIQMWDALFCSDPRVAKALENQDGRLSFALMHEALDQIWREVFRVLVPGGFACINIGDATRTLDNAFCLYPNHSRVLSAMQEVGFSVFPPILWRKPTNSPNKFMGSGMLPPGAYVTLEHEYILIFRKGEKRGFNTPEEKINRQRSAFFWEERNHWFSDVWMDLRGIRQTTHSRKVRDRSGAYPFELAYRLVNMFSVMNDTILDPFLGTGTTLVAAMASGRNSIGYELDPSFASLIRENIMQGVEPARHQAAGRIQNHLAFVKKREAAGKPLKHVNTVYGFPVVTQQEIRLVLPVLACVDEVAENRFGATYDLDRVALRNITI
ncbi:site-specific DNA-methyltransferase [Desulfosarcina sp. OttesenSCG-928-A07]|nr:site-specific DNA-methyltransferase [Desulfosarcina sp. OttesenSCG-928-G17]MDL2328390.1 site-specific DNA-methyltransferase [Desulfosarcina sp. OttesenSCG-928-A07]